MNKLLQRFDNHCDSLAAANAGGSQRAFLLPTPEFIQQRNHQPRPSRPQRMAESDRSAIHVGLLTIEAQFFLDREILGCEGLVHFDQVDVIQSEASLLER